jgi:methyl-accepting chemotaxis protein
MNYLKSMKVSGKLLMLLILTTVSLCAVGFTGYLYLNKADRNIDEMYNNNLLSVSRLNEMRAHARAIEADILDLMLTKDNNLSRELLTDIDKRIKAFDNELKLFEQKKLEPGEQENLDQLKSNLDKYRQSRKAVIDLAVQNKDAEAYELFNNSTRPIFEAFNKNLLDLAEFNIKQASENNDMNKADSKQAINLFFVIILVSTGLVIILGWLIERDITGNIKEAIIHLGVLATGDFSKAVPKEKLALRNEFGVLATAFDKMQHNMQNLIHQLSQTAEQLAASSEEMYASAEQSALAATQVATTITEVAGGAESQSKAIDDTSVTFEKMSENIQHAAANAGTVANTTNQTAMAAQEGFSAIENAIDQMLSIENTVNSSAKVVAQLGERSKEIGQIVDTISGIAGQTNLLALNAAIEAARAGEQGRGFAVVAEEVRKLAEQSQEAAKKIAALIGDIQSDTDRAVVAMNNGTSEVRKGTEVVNTAGKSFENINKLVETVLGEVQEITATLQQLAHGSKQIVIEIRDIGSVSRNALGHTQTVSAATEEQSASMEQIAASSQSLAKLAEELQHAIHQFKI